MAAQNVFIYLNIYIFFLLSKLPLQPKSFRIKKHKYTHRCLLGEIPHCVKIALSAVTKVPKIRPELMFRVKKKKSNKTTQGCCEFALCVYVHMSYLTGLSNTNTAEKECMFLTQTYYFLTNEHKGRFDFVGKKRHRVRVRTSTQAEE